MKYHQCSSYSALGLYFIFLDHDIQPLRICVWWCFHYYCQIPQVRTLHLPQILIKLTTIGSIDSRSLLLLKKMLLLFFFNELLYCWKSTQICTIWMNLPFILITLRFGYRPLRLSYLLIDWILINTPGEYYNNCVYLILSYFECYAMLFNPLKRFTLSSELIIHSLAFTS